MGHKSGDNEKLRTVSVDAEGPGGRKLVIKGSMPRDEFYTEEVTRLTTLALRGLPKINLGWVDFFGAVISFKEKAWSLAGNRHQLGEYKDASNPPQDPPLQIRLVGVLPEDRDESGQITHPTEFNFFHPPTGKLDLVRFGDLTDSDLNDVDGLNETIELERTLNPIEVTEKNLFFFYSALRYAAGERK